jgi:putative flippase GtrA
VTLRAFLEPALLRRAWRFGLSGLMVTALHAAIAAGVIETSGLHEAYANGIAFAVATLTSYLLNTYWSFSAAPARTNLLRFILVALFGLVVTMAIAGAAAKAGFSYWIGIGCVVAAVPPMTFLLHNFWTYR